jgi:hypothetical protein
MVNIILINFPSISFQIHTITFFVSIVNNANKLSFHFYPNPCSNIDKTKKFGPSKNIMYVKCMDMTVLDVIQSPHLIQSLNLCT